MPSTSERDRPDGERDPATRLERADADRRRARERVDEVGEETLRDLRSAKEELRGLLDSYDGRATGDEDFAAFIEFQEEVARFTAALDEDLPEYDTFQEIDDALQKRKLRERDFERARERLAAVDPALEPLEEWEAARERYRESRRAVRRELDRVRDRIADLERLQRLGAADLDAPVERLREPIAAGDEAVRDAFGEFREAAPARDVLELVATTTVYPLVPFEAPPADLLTYVREREAGTEPVPKLLEYADYSRSKLDHYVADADALKRAVATNRTYLRGLDAEPLTVGWPPPEAGVLRWQCDERISVVGRFAPDVVPAIRSIRELTRRDDYARLRESAVARTELSEDERERLRSGAVEDELESARERRDRLEAALSEYPAL